MLTQTTLNAISVLQEISSRGISIKADSSTLSLLQRLEAGGMIRRLSVSTSVVTDFSDYELTRPLAKISLLDLLEAIDEHLNCNKADCEHMYNRYCFAAKKLGVINQMTRLYLSEIPLTEL